MRIFRIAALAGLFATAAVAQTALAQGWKPEGPLKLVIPYAPGGSDTLGRPIARELESLLGQPVVVENVAGAEGLIGTNRVIDSPRDGRTLLLQVTSMLLTKHLPQLKGADPMAKLAPIGAFATSPVVVFSSKHLPGTTLKDVIAHCTRAPTPCSMGGAGNLAKIGSRHFAVAANLPNLITANYKSGPLILTDLIGGSLSMGFVGLQGVLAQGNAGNINLLAVAAPKRASRLPEVPTTREAGLADFEYEIWWGLFVPKGTPANVVNTLSEALHKAVQSPAVRQAVATAGSEPMWAGPQEAAAMIDKDAARYEQLVKQYPLD